MAHKTLVGGTAYNITGGKSMVSGTTYDIKGGRTLIGGTGYNIAFDRGELTAMLYSDGNFVFQYGDRVESGKTLTESYTKFENITTEPPWNYQQQDFRSVRFDGQVAPTSMYKWFMTATRMVANISNFANLNMNRVTDMEYAYYNCTNLTGSPVCGNNVKYMADAYWGCTNLTGSPVCGNNVRDMTNTYAVCINLTGSPVCGDNVISMNSTYYGCWRLRGSAVCGANVTNMTNTYYNCRNLSSPACGDKVTDMTNTYHNCQQLTSSPVCGNNVIRMVNTYRNCYSLRGTPVCGDKVTDMSNAYYNCQRLPGSPVCGNKVTNMSHTYYNCYNLSGPPVCGNNVTDMSYTYMQCNKLTGSPVCGVNVTNMQGAYYNCYNLTGCAICGKSVRYTGYAYVNCDNIGANAYFYSNQISNVKNCFDGKYQSRYLNLYVPANSTTNRTVHYNNTSSLVGANITWTTNDTCSYNTTYNIYIYPVTNVAAAAIANGDEEANANAGIIINDSEGGSGGSDSGSANYTVESVSGASYGFTLNSNGYYESSNKGKSSSAAVCKVKLVADGVSNVYFDCINYAESNYDYGLLSVVDKTLTTSYTADTTNVFKSFKGSQSASVQTVDYGVLSAGEHFIYVKYIKDSSVNSNNDSLQFKVKYIIGHGGGANS